MMKQDGYPAVFPEELVRRIIKLLSYRGDLILDTFNGVGSTTYVAGQNNRRYIGIDISQEYCSITGSRVYYILEE